jgi:two-component system response regulator MprA
MERRHRILVVDDDAMITNSLRRALGLEGYQVAVAYDGKQALEALGDETDLVILDIMMPDIDGFEVTKQIRQFSDVPILILTARDETADRVQGLDLGADDYLVKPFSMDELLARIRALLRRRAPQERPILRFADLEVDTGTRQVRRGNRSIELTAKEYELLVLFLKHPRQVLTRDVIFERIWGYDFSGQSNVLDVYVGYLRQKLEAGGEPRIIHTVRGAGYVLRE